MSEERNQIENPGELEIYRIRIMGHLGAHWAERFKDMTITLEENGETYLTGPVVDQAALYSLLRKVRDLGMPLISVTLVGANQIEKSASE